MLLTEDKIPVKLRIICFNPPPETFEDDITVFGLQDKTGALVAGEVRPDGTLVLDCALAAKRSAESDSPTFLGSYAHGTPKERFLYLSYGTPDADGRGWIKRMKIPLSGITWAHIESVGDGVLEAAIDGTDAATVQLLDGDWKIRR